MFLRVALHFEGWCVAPDEVSYPDRVWTQPTPILLVGELEELELELEELELELEELESSRLAAESDWLGRCRVPIYIMVSHVWLRHCPAVTLIQDTFVKACRDKRERDD